MRPGRRGPAPVSAGGVRGRAVAVVGAGGGAVLGSTGPARGAAGPRGGGAPRGHARGGGCSRPPQIPCHLCPSRDKTQISFIIFFGSFFG